MRVILAQPRGFCAGVIRAIDIVERALQIFGAPGVRPPRDRAQPPCRREPAREGCALRRASVGGSRRRHLDLQRARRRARASRTTRASAACACWTPPVRWSPRSTTRASATSRAGRQVILVGHAGHPEVEGHDGADPGPGAARANRGRRRGAGPRSGHAGRLHHADDAERRRHARRHRGASSAASPTSSGPDTNDICYATQNRQSAVRELAKVADVILVVGATNSSNSNRLREIGVEIGVPSYLIADGSEVRARLVSRVPTSSASPPARPRPRNWSTTWSRRCAAPGPIELSVLPGITENVEFRLPVELLRARLAQAAAS